MGQRVRANDDDEVLMDTGGGGGGDSSEVDTINEQAASAGDADAEKSLHYKRHVSCPNNNN